MRSFRVAVSLFLMAAASSVSGAGPADEIINVEKRWAKAVVAQDFAAIDRFHHDDLIYAHASGIAETKSEYLTKLKTGKQEYTAIEHHETTVRRNGYAAVAHSIVTMKGINEGTPFASRLMMMHTWFKNDGNWQLIAHQTTRM